LGLRDATDSEIFQAAREQGAIVLTKDVDFVVLQAQRGVPPQVIWLTCGNTSNARIREVLVARLPKVLALLESGEPLVEIS
jgi:predicted nuclease of predicted toxin-antitoxin system